MNRHQSFHKASVVAAAASVLLFTPGFSPAASAAVFTPDWSAWQSVPDRYQGGIDFRFEDASRRGTSRIRYQFRNRYPQKVTIRFSIEGENDEGAPLKADQTAALESGSQEVKGDAQTVPFTKLTGITLLEIRFDGTPPTPNKDGLRVELPETRRLQRALADAQSDLKRAYATQTAADQELASIRQTVGANKSKPYIDPQTGFLVSLGQKDQKLAEKRAEEAANQVADVRRRIADLEAQLGDARAADHQATLTREKGTELLQTARQAAQDGHWPEAETALRTLLTLDVSLRNADRAILSANLGVALRSENKNAEAEAAFREAVKYAPENPGFRANLGSALLAENRPVDAETELRQAARLDPKNADTARSLGYALFLQRRFADAEAAYREAVRLDPKSADSRFALGTALSEQTARQAEAEAAYREAIRLQPSSASFQTSLAICLTRQNRLGDAEAALREAARLAPSDPLNHDNLGSVLMAESKFKEAEAAYREAARLNPNNAVYRDHVAAAHEAAAVLPEKKP